MNQGVGMLKEPKTEPVDEEPINPQPFSTLTPQQIASALLALNQYNRNSGSLIKKEILEEPVLSSIPQQQPSSSWNFFQEFENKMPVYHSTLNTIGTESKVGCLMRETVSSNHHFMTHINSIPNNIPMAMVPNGLGIEYSRPCMKNVSIPQTVKGLLPTIKVDDHGDLWKKFSKEGNEMRITITGRDIFPSINYTITDLIPTAKYIMSIKLIRISNLISYKKATQKWQETCHIESNVPEESNEVFMCKAKTGKEWESSGVRFEKVKLYNVRKKAYGVNEKRNVVMTENMLLVSARHKYRPVLTVYQLIENEPKKVTQFESDEMDFVATTDYRNPNVARMKIMFNKFCTADNKLKALNAHVGAKNDENVVGEEEVDIIQ